MKYVVQDPPLKEPVNAKDTGQMSTSWEQFFRDVWKQINRLAPRPAVAVVVGASPFTYQAPFAGDTRIIVAGGTVSALAYSRDGVVYYPIGIVAGMVTLSQGDFIKITYTVVPTVTAIPA